MNQIYFYIPEMFKANDSNRFLSTKSPLNLYSHVVNSQRLFSSKKNWCEIFILKISGTQKVYNDELKPYLNPSIGFCLQILHLAWCLAFSAAQNLDR